MFGGSEEAQKHTPTLTRQWLKDKILQELPSVKSVRQKDRRKPSVLYCPEACEEDMVNIAMVQDYESEMDNMKMLYKTAKLIRRRIVEFNDEKKKSDMICVLSTTKDVPPQLYSLMRWILIGPEEELQTDMRRRTVDQSALTLSVVCFQNQKAGATPTQANNSHIQDTTSLGKSTSCRFGTKHSS